MSAANSIEALPDLIAHADWSVDKRKRWMAQAIRKEGDAYRAYLPKRVGELGMFLPGLKEETVAGGCVLVGFDFPIGLPLTYAKQVKVTAFLDLDPQLGSGEWQDFFEPATLPEQINRYRPFYPAKPGSARREHLEKALDLKFQNLFRQCEVESGFRRAACPLFWTLGGQQVGKAAITGWQQVLIPGLKDGNLGLRLWPFHGPLSGLMKPGTMVALETYPGEFYHHLGLAFPRRSGERSGKRSQASRAANAPRLLDWADRARVLLEPELEAEIQDGFGNLTEGEDRFDALIGLFGMLNLVLGLRPLEEPKEEGLKDTEGWIFGQSLNPGEKGSG